MRKIIGVVCVVAAVILAVQGHDIATSVGGQVQKAFTGDLPQKALWLYLASGVLGALGLYQIFAGKK